MKILIIGGSRFAGPYIVDMLLMKKHDVTVFNRGFVNASYNSKVRYIRGDRDKGFGIKDSFDVVIDTCAYTAKQTAKAVNDLSFKHFINFSTVAVYKDAPIFPIQEENPIGGIGAFGSYGVNKSGCESILQKSDVRYANIRPTYILGPKNYCDRENFIYSRLLAKNAIVIPGNGEAVVQFVFVEEVARSIVYLAENKLTGNYNCVGDDLITLNGLVRVMAKIAGVKPIIKYNQNADGSSHIEEEFPFANANSIYSNKKIKDLGIKFKPLLEGLEKDYKGFYKKSIKEN